MPSKFYFLAFLLVATTYRGAWAESPSGERDVSGDQAKAESGEEAKDEPTDNKQATSVIHRWGTPGTDDEIIATGNITAKPSTMLGFIKVANRKILTYAPLNETNLPTITAIEVQDIPERAENGGQTEVHILYGGVGSTNVAIRFSSHRGRGMFNEIKIWGRYNNELLENEEEKSEENEPERKSKV